MVNDQSTWTSIEINTNAEIRTFNSNQLFEWHWDAEDRILEVIDFSGKWQFQLDNSKPINLTSGLILDIVKAGIWHRMICIETGSISIKVTKL